MSDIVNAFKQTKGYKKRKDLLSGTQEVAQQPQEQETDNQVLNASQQQNIALDTSGTKDSDRLAQLEQLAAAETAQNEANKQAAIAADEARKQAEEAQKRVQEQSQQMSRADASRRNFDDINSGANSLYNDYVNAYNATKDSYKNILGDSASGTANYHINNVLNKIKDKDENALSSSQSFMNAYNQLSSDDKWDVYQNLQDAKTKIKQAYAVAEKNNNSDMMNNLSTMYKYADMYEGMVSDVDKGDKSFFKSIGDWLTSGGVAGDLAEPLTNALGDITGNTETSRAITENRATKEEGNNGAVQFMDVGSNLVANTALNMATGGWYGMGTAGANLVHEGVSAFNDADRDYALNEEGKLERQNQTNEQKLSDIGGSLFSLGLSAAGMKGVGPNIKFSGGETLQNLVKNKNYGEIAKGILKYAGKELPWAAATTAGETGIKSIGYGGDAWKQYGENLLNNIVGDLAMDVTGAIREGQSGNRDLFRVNQETGKVELDSEISSRLSDEDNAKVQQRLDDFQEGVKNAVDNEGKVEQETGRVDENGKVEDVSKVDETKLNQDAKAVSDETNARITAEQMTRNSENSQRVNKNTETSRDMLNESQKQAYNKQVEAIRNELQSNKISYDQYIQRIEQIQNQFIQQAQSGQVEQQEQSATGQQINPEDVSNIVEGAEGTQASEATTKQTTPVEQFGEARSEATTKQSEMGEGMARTEGEDPIERAYDSARQRYQEALQSGDRGAIEAARERYNQLLSIRANEDVTGYDYQTGVKINDMLAQRMYENGYDGARTLADQMFDITEGNRPLAYDYGTKEPLYMYEDIVEALRKYKGVDADGNQYRTSQDITSERNRLEQEAFRQAIDESIARSEEQPARVEDTDALNDLLAEAAMADRGFTAREEAPARNEQPTENEYRNAIEQKLAEYTRQLEDTGLTPETIRKIQENNRAGQEVNKLTPEEMAQYRNALEVMGVENVDAQASKYYLPQQFEGSDYSGRATTELLSGGLENVYNRKRQNLIGLNEMDYTKAPLADYMLRTRDADLQVKAAAQDTISRGFENATPEQVTAGSEALAKVITDINSKADDTTNKGFNEQTVQKMQAFSKLNEAGEKMGNQLRIDDTKAHGLNDYERLVNSNNWDSGLEVGTLHNLNVYARATGDEVNRFITEHFNGLNNKQKQEILGRRTELENRYTKMYGNEQLGTMFANKAMLKDAAIQNFIKVGMTTKYSDPKMQKVVNDVVSTYMLRDRVKQSAVQKVASAISRAMNSSFRGMRWQTTLNEIPEIFNSLRDYGKIQMCTPKEAGEILQRYGVRSENTFDSFLRSLPQEAQAKVREVMESGMSDKEQLSALKKIGEGISKTLNKADELTQWNGFVQDWKDSAYLKTAENYYRRKGYDGIQLMQKVTTDFYNNALPMDRVFKIIKSDKAWQKPMFMYLDASARLTVKSARAAVGNNTAGRNADMNRAGRIANNAALNLAPRVMSAVAMGVPVASVMGLFTIGGDDYSGIDEEHKNALDEVLNFAADFSPLLSVGVQAYNAQRQDEIAEQEGYGKNDISWEERARNNALKTFTPLGNWLDQEFGTFGNRNSLVGVADRGYGENKQGRVTYMSPDNPLEWITGAVAGMNKTPNAREYNKNPDLLSSILNQAKGNDYNNDGQIDGGFNDFIRYNQAFNSTPLDLGLKSDDDYNRPLSKYDNANYSGMVKEAIENGDRELAQDWYKRGREYNAITDKLRMENPTASEVYYESMGNNLVSPEKWKTVLYGQNPNGEPDLTVWNTMKQLALKRGEDFGTPVDPAYTQLDDEQTRRYLQYKSTATGEDTALKKIMTQDPFWKEFFNKQKEYYASLPESEYDDSGKTARVQEWNDWNDQYSDYMSFISGNLDGMNDQQLGLSLSLQFPLMAEYQSLKTALQSKYGDEYKNSQEYKNFWKQNYDAYSAESDAFNGQMLYIINQMRRIEGYDDLTLDELETVNNIGKDSSSSKNSGYSKRSGGSSGDGGYSYAPYFENTFQAAPVYASVPKAGKMRYNPAGRANFNKVPMSGTMGGQPYAAV